MAEATQKRARDADAVDLTEDASPEKKHKVALNAIAKEFICPITQELPVDPVIAKDGKIYERDAILEWFRKKDGDATSPSTGKVIDTELVPVVQARNTIESLIQTGAIEDEIAEAWQKRLAFEKRVKEMRAKVEGRRRGCYALDGRLLHVRPGRRERRGASPRVVRAQRGGPESERPGEFQ